ncbi:MAG: SAM hydrolase/SAM-dependent halogenase family protein [Geminicoccales bacterium]
MGAFVVVGWFLAAAPAWSAAPAPNGTVVFESDFGLEDGAVSAMHGVALSLDPTLRLEDLTHEIPPFNIWEGAYRLAQTAPYWPKGTVFVTVIDPGVGTERKSIALETASGHYFVGPDNGTFTLVADQLGIEAVRVVDESRHRRPGSERSSTFHGRDIYALTGAELASGRTAFEDIGPLLQSEMVRIPFQKPALEGDHVTGTVPVLDVRFGNVWTNIDRATFEKLGLALGDTARVRIFRGEQLVFEGSMPYVATFGDVPEGKTLLYLNSLDAVSFAINLGSFATTYGIGSGPDWRAEVRKG